MRRSGYSLIELVITVGIIGLLAAVAIPGYLRFQLKSKLAEAPTNLRAISKAEGGYYVEHGHYASVNLPVPAAVPSNQKLAWPAGSGFEDVGWSPEGGVFFQYRVGADDGAGAGPRFTAEARGDVDGDGSFAFFAFVHPSSGQAAGLPGALPGSTCQATGVHDRSGSGASLDTPGPCDPQTGISRF